MVLRLGDTWYGAHFIGELAEITRIKVEAREFFLRLASMQTMRVGRLAGEVSSEWRRCHSI